MNCYEELKARGLIAQTTNEDEISKLVNEGRATFACGTFYGSLLDEEVTNGRK